MTINKEKYIEAKKSIEAMMNVVKCVDSGLSLNKACEKSGVSLYAFTRFMSNHKNYAFNKNEKVEDKKEDSQEDKYVLMTWQELLYANIMGAKISDDYTVYHKGDFYIPSDIDENLVLVMKDRLKERHLKVILMRWRDGLMFDEIAKQLGVSTERVRQIEHEAFRRLLHPTVKNRLRYGINYYENQKKQNELVNELANKKYKEYIRQQLEEQADTLAKDKVRMLNEMVDREKTIMDMKEAEAYSIMNQGFSVRTVNSLDRARIKDIREVAKLKFSEVTRIRNLGSKSLLEVYNVLLNKYGIDMTKQSDWKVRQ